FDDLPLGDQIDDQDRHHGKAGKMDGLSRFGVWWKIALPMARPALAAVSIITFLFSWNLFLEPMIFLSSIDMFTLPLALSNFNDSYGLPL
ncbi:ABC transporter permease subunit, partial [Rhizobium johnstonii]|uniref:ABC transporter permease subunit n=1 Tax=Rhizobium johnstonii TaxID=3019933 RepID=UPI003F9C7012